MATETTNVIAGIDTHSDTHHVAVINEHGKPLADKEFLAVGSGYRKIVDFITSHGSVTAVGVEGTGSYGAEIARTLRGEGLCVLEVNRPNRAARRLKGKSDPLDAYQAAQSVLDGRTTAIPKAKDRPVECLRILRAGRSSALKARTAAINQIKGLLVSAPDKLRAKYRGLGTSAMITALQRTRPTGHMADPEYVCLLTLKALATRCQTLAAEIATADAALQEILDTYAPLLCDLPGVGTEVASQLMVTAGDNPDRFWSPPSPPSPWSWAVPGAGRKIIRPSALNQERVVRAERRVVPAVKRVPGSPLPRWSAPHSAHTLAKSHVALISSEHLTVRRWDARDWQNVGRHVCLQSPEST